MHDGKAVSLAILMAYAFGRPTIDGIDDVGRAFDGTEAIEQTVSEGVDDTSTRHFSVRKRVICLQTIEKSVESSRSGPETGAGEGIGSPLRLQHSSLCKHFSQFCNITGSVNTHL